MEMAPADFLFLVANTTDRTKAMRKFTSYDRTVKRARHTNIFPIDECTYAHPDPYNRLQIHNSQSVDPSKVKFLQNNVKQIKFDVKKEENKESAREKEGRVISGMINDPKLYNEIKTTITGSEVVLRSTRASSMTEPYQAVRQSISVSDSVERIAAYSSMNTPKSHCRPMSQDSSLRSAQLFLTKWPHHANEKYTPRFDIRGRPDTMSGTYSTITFYGKTPKHSTRGLSVDLDMPSSIDQNTRFSSMQAS